MSTGALTQVIAPSDWTWQPLWASLQRVKDFGQPDGRPLSVYLDSGVVPRDTREDNHNRLGEDLSRYLVVKPGDIVFNKLRTWQGGLGVSAFAGIVSPAYFVCRPGPAYEPRFLHYLLRSVPYLTELTRISKWMPPSQFDTPWETLRTLPILTPLLEEQRRIADFLDAETSRMDRLAQIRTRQRELLRARRWSHFEELIVSARAASVPLRRVILSITDGPFGSAFSSSDYVDNGVNVIRLGNIGFAEYKRDGQASIPHSMLEKFRQFEVKRGDVLIASLGDPRNHAGRACVAPDLGPAIVKGKCFRMRLNPEAADPYFTSLMLSSPIGSSSFEGRGSTRSMINLEIVKSAQFPIPGLAAQIEIVEECQRAWRRTKSLIEMCDRQLTLLTERRQTLITAAVTGQFDVTTASGRNITQGV